MSELQMFCADGRVNPAALVNRRIVRIDYVENMSKEHRQEMGIPDSVSKEKGDVVLVLDDEMRVYFSLFTLNQSDDVTTIVNRKIVCCDYVDYVEGLDVVIVLDNKTEVSGWLAAAEGWVSPEEFAAMESLLKAAAGN